MATVDGATDTEPARDRAGHRASAPVATVYEPGSTNKVITMAAAIEDGVVQPDTVINEVYTSIRVGDKDYEDVESHASTMTVTDILRESSNVGTIKIANDARQGALRPLPAGVRLRAHDDPRPPG